MLRSRTAFQVEPLGDMVAVGALGPRSVRLWIRSRCPGRLLILIRQDGEEQICVRSELDVPESNSRDHTLSVLLPNDVPGAIPFEPLTRYCFRITRVADGRPVRDRSGAAGTDPVASGAGADELSSAVR